MNKVPEQPGHSAGNGYSWGPRGMASAVFSRDVTFENIRHSYGSQEALKGVNLVCRAGEIIAVLGQSGCGKTTLLRIGAGIIRQQSGSVLVNGQVISDGQSHLPAEKRGIGLVFQDFALFPHMTVLDNVTYGLRSAKKSVARDIAMVGLERVGLSEYADAYPHMLSGGQQQRVAFIRAIVPRPGILLMDEPFSGLDQRLRETMQQETLALLRETHATCLLVTHDPEEAMLMGDRIVLMDEGIIVQEGTPQDLYYRPASLFAAKFFSPLSIFSTRVWDRSAETPLGRFEAPDLAEGDPALVAIRPQGFQITEEGKGVAGRVRDRRFFGVADLVEVAIKGIDEPVMIRVRGNTASVGDDVGITVNPNEAFVFPA